MTPTPMPALPKSTVDHLAELIAQQSTDRLLAIVMLLGLVFMIAAAVVVWGAFPLVREGNRARFEMSQSYKANTQAMEAVKEELVVLRRSFEEHYPKSFFRWITGR